MSADKTTPASPKKGGAVARTPNEIANDPTLSNARKIELLKSIKELHAAPGDQAVLREADIELEKLLVLNSPAHRH